MYWFLTCPLHAVCHAHSYRLSYIWHPILISSTSLFVIIENITFRGILIKILCPLVATSVCDTPPLGPTKPVCSPTIVLRTFNFHFAVPVVLRYPKEALGWMFVTVLLASSISLRQNKMAEFIYAHGFHVHLSIRPPVCLSVCLCLLFLPSNHEFIIPSTCLSMRSSVIFSLP